jgi:hypothetical protein
LTTACYGTVEWYESFRFKGRIEEIIVDGKMLVLKEFDASAGSKSGNTFQIPVDKIDEYEVGDRFLVIVESNTYDDDWDLNHLRFELISIDK